MKSSSVNRDHVFFPMLVSLLERKCVVVGAGKIAATKIESLLQCGARVEVVSPRVASRVAALAKAGAIVWRRKAFSPPDLEGAFLVVAATNSRRTNGAVFCGCNRHGVLCNSVDDPAHCDFIYPAVVRRGALQIAISTGGRSPALSARLRRELERQFGPEWAVWVEYLGKQRDELRRGDLPAETRRRRLQSMASQQTFDAFLRKQASRRSQAGETAAVVLVD